MKRVGVTLIPPEKIIFKKPSLVRIKTFKNY